MQNVRFDITRVEKDQPEVWTSLHQEHINEILDLVRRECNLGAGETMSISRLEVLDDIIEAFKYQLRGE